MTTKAIAIQEICTLFIKTKFLSDQTAASTDQCKEYKKYMCTPGAHMMLQIVLGHLKNMLSSDS